jgi:hypothetical protein
MTFSTMRDAFILRLYESSTARLNTCHGSGQNDGFTAQQLYT